MVLIERIRIERIDDRRPRPFKPSGLNISFGIERFSAQGTQVEVGFTYRASCKGSFGPISFENGSLAIHGTLFANEPNAATMSEGWKKNKQLPNEFNEFVLSVLNELPVRLLTAQKRAEIEKVLQSAAASRPGVHPQRDMNINAIVQLPPNPPGGVDIFYSAQDLDRLRRGEGFIKLRPPE